MGEPIHLPDGRIAYGRAQAAVMEEEAAAGIQFVTPDQQAIASPTKPTRPVIDDSDILTVGDDRYKEAVRLASLLPAPADSVSFQSVRGIGPGIESELYNAGILTWVDVAQAGVVEIVRRVPAISLSRARALFAMAQREAK